MKLLKLLKGYASITYQNLFCRSHGQHFELKTQRHGELFKLMHHIVLGDDPEIKQGKPSLDVFLAAARRFEGGPIDSQKILVFEDAPVGALAAKNAGMIVEIHSFAGHACVRCVIVVVALKFPSRRNSRSVVMVPDPRLDSFHHAMPDQVLSSLSDFNPSEWGLPAFENA
ncbi:hypothetical protein REPUB_Repub18cG0040100 [Reevesia pubescens]